MYNATYYAVLDELKKVAPYEECEYFNGIIASAFGKGKKERLTEDWLRKALLLNVEDEFMTYGQALAMKDIYLNKIEELKKVF